ncbi:hypothetical protein J6590_089747 [Homalodisca vitripennis]|nr:hypothetical protein J6590_089747 [Homalodisca vitripennis]
MAVSQLFEEHADGFRCEASLLVNTFPPTKPNLSKEELRTVLILGKEVTKPRFDRYITITVAERLMDPLLQVFYCGRYHRQLCYTHL